MVVNGQPYLGLSDLLENLRNTHSAYNILNFLKKFMKFDVNSKNPVLGP